MDPLTIMALASVAQLGFGIYSQNRQVQAHQAHQAVILLLTIRV